MSYVLQRAAVFNWFPILQHHFLAVYLIISTGTWVAVDTASLNSHYFSKSVCSTNEAYIPNICVARTLISYLSQQKVIRLGSDWHLLGLISCMTCKVPEKVPLFYGPIFWEMKFLRALLCYIRSSAFITEMYDFLSTAFCQCVYY